MCTRVLARVRSRKCSCHRNHLLKSGMWIPSALLSDRGTSVSYVLQERGKVVPSSGIPRTDFFFQRFFSLKQNCLTFMSKSRQWVPKSFLLKSNPFKSWGWGFKGGSVSWASAFGSGHDLGVLGLSSVLRGGSAWDSLPLPLSPTTPSPECVCAHSLK